MCCGGLPLSCAQTVTFGYPGIRIQESGLRFRPVCPERARSVKVRGLAYLGGRLTLAYGCGPRATATLTLTSEAHTPLVLVPNHVDIGAASFSFSNLRGGMNNALKPEVRLLRLNVPVEVPIRKEFFVMGLDARVMNDVIALSSRLLR
jgi:hypothetical protein